MDVATYYKELNVHNGNIDGLEAELKETETSMSMQTLMIQKQGTLF